MKNKICNLIIAISINLTFMAPCWSFVKSVAIWKKDNKKVAVFGDTHAVTELDTQHKELFLPFFEQLAEGDRKTQVILEHRDEEYVRNVKNPKCISYLSRYAYERKLRKGNLAFILSDIRTIFPGLDLATDIFFLFSDLLSNDNKHINASLTDWMYKGPLPHSKVLEEIGIVLNIVTTYKEMVTNKEAYAFFEETAQRIKTLESNLKEFFKIYNQDVSIIRKMDELKLIKFEFPAGTVVASFLQAAQEGSFSKHTLKDLRNRYLDLLVDDLAEVIFIKDIIESQKDFDVSLVYVGLSHAIVINRLLLALGYTLDESLSEGPLFELTKASPLSTEKLEKIMSSFFIKS